MLLPEWTERAAKRGLDPLGLQNSSVQLYQSLLPGISNVTLRVRYYGLYCWASETYAREVGSTDVAEWKAWIRRLEALHALVSVRVGGEIGVAGVEWAQRRLAQDDDEVVDFSEGASSDRTLDVYLGQSFGVFGQAYLSQLIELRLFAMSTNHDIPTRTEAGRALAEAFGESIGEELEQALIDGIKAAAVTRTQLRRMSPILPSRIGTGPERDAYEAVLFGTGADTPTEADRSRRDTLALVLYCAEQIAGRPNAAIVRRRLFSAEAPVPAPLEKQRLRWEAYQAQDLWQVAAAALLGWSISIIDEFENGRSLPEIHGEVSARLRDRWPGDAERSWQDMRTSVAADDKAFDERNRRLISSRGSIEDRALLAVEQMCALDQRCRSRPDLEDEVARSFALGGGGRSIRSELLWIRDRESFPLAGLTADLVAQRVVSRHIWVATQKLRRQRDYTFLFESRDGRLAFRSQYDPVQTTPRLDPAIQFLVDIDLLGPAGCTEAGRVLIGAAS